ncbi:ferredoxin reductase family protein [Granulosicoccaceae sp. 1_MG-2023]|nr:ferredoxin reductase family protein [Granulosicoccaceae sp. 1_MG-2023]
MATRKLYWSSPQSGLYSLSAAMRKIKPRYWLLLAVPWLATLALHMDFKGWYSELLSVAWLVGMAAFFIQFALGGRIRKGSLFGNIDWSMSRHKQVGKLLGYLFFLHPFLILAPRFLMSWDDGVTSLVSVLTAPSMLTGLIAWGLMLVFVLLAVFKRSLPLRYETWRLLHLLAFAGVAVLATLHVTSVGRHGQFQPLFNRFWWALLAGVSALMIYNHLIKPLRLKRKPFTLKSIERVSRSDWQLTLEKPPQTDFDFAPGQFVWINTSGSAFDMNDHPFSIASCRKDLPQLSFIVRELGDYTGKLGDLTPGQQVYVDGPYGSMSLADSARADGIVLVAGGAGIGPMLSLLRGLAARQESRPVRLVYGNASIDQMVLQEEIRALETQMADFKQLLVCSEPQSDPAIHHGLIDREVLEKALGVGDNANRVAYVCGPPAMVQAAKRHARALGVPGAQIHYEQLAF